MHATYKQGDKHMAALTNPLQLCDFQSSRAHASAVILCSVHDVPLKGSTGALSVESYNIG